MLSFILTFSPDKWVSDEKLRESEYATFSIFAHLSIFSRGYSCISSFYGTASQEFLGHSISWAHFTSNNLEHIE